MPPHAFALTGSALVIDRLAAHVVYWGVTFYFPSSHGFI